MQIEIDSNKAKNLGSSKKMFDYLEKENAGKKEEDKEKFFDQKRDDISPEEATETIDQNVAKLSQDKEKYFSLYISPSPKEIKAIGGDVEKMKTFVRGVMDEYAKSFYNKGLTGDDLIYFGKIERTRSFKNLDVEVKNGFAKNGEKKPGDQMHAHVIVSRKDVTNTKKLSPKDEAKGGDNFKVPGKEENQGRGFNRNLWRENSEKLFDKVFDYQRSPEESFYYKRLQKNSPDEFQKQYGEAPQSEKKVRTLQTDTAKFQYSQRNLNNIVGTAGSKAEADALLEKKGIRIEGNNVIIMDKKIPISSFGNLSLATTEKLNSLYNVTELPIDSTRLQYGERNVNNILVKGTTKETADSYFKKQGMTVKGNSVEVMGNKIPVQAMKNISPTAMEMLAAYYLVNKFNRAMEGKGEEEEKEKDR